MQRFVLSIGLLSVLISPWTGRIANAATAIPEDKYSAVVLVYHRIGEGRLPGQ